MLQGKRIAVVVPAYNEEALIEKTINSIPRFVDRIVVVDDASTDHTAEIVRASKDVRVELVQHLKNQGVGTAISSGYAAAFRPVVGAPTSSDIAVVMAGDNQMDPRNLRELLEPVLTGKADYAKGNRFAQRLDHREMPIDRVLGNRTLSQLTSWALGLSIHDSQCGYTAITRDAAACTDSTSLFPRYGYPNELLGRLVRAKVRIVEVPVRAVYGEEKSGLHLHHALLLIPSLIAREAWRTRIRPQPSSLFVRSHRPGEAHENFDTHVELSGS